MVDSVFTGSVVVVDEVAAGCFDDSRFPELPAVPDAGGEGEDALAYAGPDAFGDAAAVVFERELAFGGVVDRFDPLRDTAVLAESGFLPLRSGRMRVASKDATVFSISPEKPLSATIVSPPVSKPALWARSSIAAPTSRSPCLAGAGQKETGIPSGAYRKYSRSPEK